MKRRRNSAHLGANRDTERRGVEGEEVVEGKKWRKKKKRFLSVPAGSESSVSLFLSLSLSPRWRTRYEPLTKERKGLAKVERGWKRLRSRRFLSFEEEGRWEGEWEALLLFVENEKNSLFFSKKEERSF